MVTIRKGVRYKRTWGFTGLYSYPHPLPCVCGDGKPHHHSFGLPFEVPEIIIDDVGVAEKLVYIDKEGNPVVPGDERDEWVSGRIWT